MRPYHALIAIAKGILTGEIISSLGLSKKATKTMFPTAPEDEDTGLVFEYKEAGRKKGKTVVFPSCHVLNRRESDIVLKNAKR